MKIFLISVGRIYWGINKTDPPIQNLKSLPDFFFINPLLYPEIEHLIKIESRNILKEIKSEICWFLDNDAVVETECVLLGTERENINCISVDFLEAESTDYIEIIYEYMLRFLPNLKQSSKQVTMKQDVIQIQVIELHKLPNVIFPQPPEKKNISESLIKKYIVDTKATWQNIFEADDNVIVQKTPVYEKLLLDAIHAYDVKDYRRTLLYSAISLETLAATKLDEVYESFIQDADFKEQLRIVPFPQKKGDIIFKDPVYKMLRERARFLELLHEVALYILGKSLLLENHTLYQKAEKIYKTRNKIAHLGEANNDNQGIFHMNSEDTLQAIESTIDIFRWFGVTTDFPIPKLGFVEGYSGRSFL